MEDNKNKISEEQGNDNIYVYPEEDNDNDGTYDSIGYTNDDEEYADEESKYSKLDQSGPNYSQAERTADEMPNNGNGKNDNSSFLLMLKVLLNPTEGWKSIRRKKLTAEECQRGCFYPLLALLAISKFAAFIHESRVNLNEVLVNAVTAFVSFFFGYFCIMILLKAMMPEKVKESISTEFGKVFIITTLSTLCLFFSVLDIFPMLWAVLIFLPLWTIYVICRGVRFFKFPEHKKISCTAIICLLVVGIPCVIDWMLSKIL